MYVNVKLKQKATYLVREKSEVEEIISVTSDEALKAIRCIRKRYCLGERGNTIDITKEAGEEFANL